MSVADDIFAIFEQRGAQLYFGESVSLADHCLQAAHFASSEAPPALIAAALLHDIGHLIEAVPEDFADWTTDGRHEEAGSRWLAGRFGREVSEPVRLHVPAKRYLCATDTRYFAKLSAASVRTLQLQGGPMSPPEVAAFEREAYFREAVRVRQWDDRGKVAGLATRPLAAHRALLEGLSR
jgi:predicted HD phosphohydrolase